MAQPSLASAGDDVVEQPISEASDRQITAGRHIAEIIAHYGVSHVFFVDAILRRTLTELYDLGILRILAHSEKAAAYMADGYARASGRVGICMSQSVGAMNLASGLQDALLGQSAIVAMTGRQVADNQYRSAYQELPHDEMFRAVTKWHAKIETTAQLSRLLPQAFRMAVSGTPGPVHLDIAGLTGDALAAQTDKFKAPENLVGSTWPAHRPRPGADALASAAMRIATARRPIIIADRGAMVSDAGAAIEILSRQGDIPVAGTLDAKAVLPERHPNFAGIVGAYGRTCTNRVVAAADLVIFAGSNTSDQATANWTLPSSDTPTVQININPAEIGRNYPNNVGLVCDVRAACEDLAAKLDAANRAEWLDFVRTEVEQWRAASSDAPPADVTPEALCRSLTQVLPNNAVLVADTGFAAQWTGNSVELNAPGQSYFRAAGSLGWSFPASLGVKCAVGPRPVVCFTGDGGFYYHLAELETARRWDINTVTVVNNNGGLAQGLKNINAAYEGRPVKGKEELFAFRPTDFAAIARSFECVGLTVEKVSDLEPALREALGAGRPVVIDVKTEFGRQIPSPWLPSA